MPAEIDSLRYTSGAKFFDPVQAEVFPQADFEMCTQLNKFDFVMKLEKSPDGLSFMEKLIFDLRKFFVGLFLDIISSC